MNNTQYALVVTMSFLSLVETSFAVPASVCLLLIYLQRLRKFDVIIVYLLGLLFFWLAAYQNPINIPSFIIGSISVVTGYTDGMSYDGKTESSDLVVWFLASIFLVSMVHKYLSPLRLSAFIFILFTAFKHGFVRHDGHEVASTATLLLMGLAVIAIRAKGKTV